MARKEKPTPRERLESLLNENATVTPQQLYATGQFGGRNSVYDACVKGVYECFRSGRLFIIPTAPLRRKLGIDGAAKTRRPRKVPGENHPQT
jgi:hypothetical protein